MSRLYRPYTSIEVRCRVAMRQLGEIFPDEFIADNSRNLGAMLEMLLAKLADLLGCGVEDLRLDHDPALALRKKRSHFVHKTKQWIDFYTPDANDEHFLAYRPHGTKFAGSHDVKTRIRGDHGQFSDTALIKRERRRQKKQKKQTKRGKAWASRPLRSASRWPKGRKIRSRS
jgi:hypothetical protein